MAHISRRRHGELVQALFNLLKEHPDGLKAGDALRLLRERVTLTEYEKGAFNSGGDRFDTIVRFATVDTVRAGWMIKHQRVWTVTAEGMKALMQYPDPEEFFRTAALIYQQWYKAHKAVSEDTGSTDDTDELPIEDNARDTTVTFEAAEEQARDAIEKHIQAMPPYEFQELVADLLRGMGYFVSDIAAPGKDGGVDIIAHTDALGTQGTRIKVQVKRQQASTGGPEVKSFVANIGQHDCGIFVCTGGFSRDAKEFVRGHETKRIMLIDMERLIELWTEFLPKLSEQARQRMPLTPIYFLTPIL